jgi:uncharacterized protein (TIGR02757 family)
MNLKQRKAQLDALVATYHHPDFVRDDPMQFASPFKHELPRCEANALLASLLSYGRREVIIRKLTELFDRLEAPVYDVLHAESLAPVEKRLKGFIYRFNTGADLVQLLRWWQVFYERHPSHLACLESLPETQNGVSRDILKPVMSAWLDAWLPPDFLAGGYSNGTRYLVPHPATGGACKRLHMALRWMCRDDQFLGENAVDFGVWTSVIPPHALLMPMDTHVGRLSREWGLLKRNSTDWKASEELTARLARFDQGDPCRYDFAFLGYGVDEVRGRLKDD